MSLGIAALTPEGIVLSADSRQTYTNLAKTNRVGTDNAQKLFKLGKKIGVVIAGRAFAVDDKQQIKSTGWFIEQFRESNMKLNDKLSTKEITQQLIDYLKEKKVDSMSLIVAGYDLDGVGRAYLVNVPGETNEDLSRNTSVGGFLRIGQDEVVTRVMNGWSYELINLDFIKELQAKGVNVFAELSKAQYIVNWGTITMQDSVDFCVSMTKMTENVQRFSDGTPLNPGGNPGVGGPVDVATITLDNGFQWLRRKQLKINEE